MYLNEKSFEIVQDDKYIVDCAMKNFLDIYATIKQNYSRLEIYIPQNEPIYLRSAEYPIGKWLASTDQEYKRLFLTFYDKCIKYSPEKDYEVIFQNQTLIGGTEAYLNNSFMISICLTSEWKQDIIGGTLYALEEPSEKNVFIKNIFDVQQVEEDAIKNILSEENSIQLYSYDDLWLHKEDLFPHLRFCPSVEQNLAKLQKSYLKQVKKKLCELENYCAKYGSQVINTTLISKTTQESKSTLSKYKTEHTFCDENNTNYIASWHMRFTGIPGRIYFVPNYKTNYMLICFIGRKLPNVTYST